MQRKPAVLTRRPLVVCTRNNDRQAVFHLPNCRAVQVRYNLRQILDPSFHTFLHAENSICKYAPQRAPIIIYIGGAIDARMRKSTTLLLLNGRNGDPGRWGHARTWRPRHSWHLHQTAHDLHLWRSVPHACETNIDDLYDVLQNAMGRMRSDHVIQSVVGSVGIGSCIRREPNEVSLSFPRFTSQPQSARSLG